MVANLLAALVAGLLSAPADKDADKLQGTWTIVSSEEDGQPVAKLKGVTFTFAGEKVTMTQNGQEKKGTFKLDPDKKLKEIDLTEDGSGNSMKGIYSIDGDTLKLCFPSGRDGQRPSEFSGKKDAKSALVELKREKK